MVDDDGDAERAAVVGGDADDTVCDGLYLCARAGDEVGSFVHASIPHAVAVGDGHTRGVGPCTAQPVSLVKTVSEKLEMLVALARSTRVPTPYVESLVRSVMGVPAGAAYA